MFPYSLINVILHQSLEQLLCNDQANPTGGQRCRKGKQDADSLHYAESKHNSFPKQGALLLRREILVFGHRSYPFKFSTVFSKRFS